MKFTKRQYKNINIKVNLNKFSKQFSSNPPNLSMLYCLLVLEPPKVSIISYYRPAFLRNLNDDGTKKFDVIMAQVKRHPRKVGTKPALF